MESLDDWIEVRRLPWTRVAVEELAGRLPVDDAVMDGWLGEVVAKREEIAFRNLVFAGLGAGRPLWAKHLVEGTALFQDTDQLHRTAVRFSGDVGSALVAAVETGRLEPDREAVALALAAMWCRERREGQWTPGLMAAARRLGRRGLVLLDLDAERGRTGGEPGVGESVACPAPGSGCQRIGSGGALVAGR